MKVLLSPAKKQELFKTDHKKSKPLFLSCAKDIIRELKVLEVSNYQSILKISDKLLDINTERLKEWCSDPQPDKCSAAIFSFKGEAFSYLNPGTLSDEKIQELNKSLLIFSGLYGFLRPLDEIMLYRLDIGDKLELEGYKSLYDFWSERLTDFLIKEMNSDYEKILVNLSSKEYSKSINFKKIPASIITPDFKTLKNGRLKTDAIWSKRMRGLLTRKIITENVKTENELQKVVLDGYKLESTDNSNYLYIKDGD